MATPKCTVTSPVGEKQFRKQMIQEMLVAKMLTFHAIPKISLKLVFGNIYILHVTN